MKLVATIETSIFFKENETEDEAKARVVQKLVDSIDDWINDGGPTPMVKIHFEYNETDDDRHLIN